MVMKEKAPIQYLPSHEINKDKWDECVRRSSNGLLYADRIYLDMMTDHWNAAVIGDYEAVMPLPWRKKWMFKYYYHAAFVPQTGIYGPLDASLYKPLTKLIFKKIKYGDILLNYGNADYAEHLSARPLVNMTLDLSPDYETLRGKFHRDIEKNLKKSARHNLNYLPGNNVKKCVQLFRKQYGSRIISLKRSDYERFTSLCLHLLHINQAIIRKVTDKNGRLLALALMLKDDRRIYNMMNTVLPDGKSKSANHFLFDQMIREFAGSGLVFDFEGSDVSGIKKFYKNFGAVNEPYFLYSRFSSWI